MKFVIFVVLALCASGYGIRCPTCKDTTCRGLVPSRECTFRSPFPLNTIVELPSIRSVNENWKYGCLDVSYLDKTDGENHRVKQCVVLQEERDPCNDLTEVYEVQSCRLINGVIEAIQIAVPDNEEFFDDEDNEEGSGGDQPGGAEQILATLAPVIFLITYFF